MRHFEGGRPIEGWQYGEEVRSVLDVALGEVLIADCLQFSATNLIRVKSMREITPGDVSGFYYVYVSPDLSEEWSGGSADTMLMWHFDIDLKRTAVYRAVRE